MRGFLVERIEIETAGRDSYRTDRRGAGAGWGCCGGENKKSNRVGCKLMRSPRWGVWGPWASRGGRKRWGSRRGLEFLFFFLGGGGGRAGGWGRECPATSGGLYEAF